MERGVDQIKWLINRSDQLRLAIASGAGTLISAIVILITAVSFFLNFVIRSVRPTAPQHPWSIYFLIGTLVGSWILLGIALLLAVSAIAKAHGLTMSHTSKENPLNSIADVTLDADEPQKQLYTAALFQRAAQTQLKRSLLMLTVAMLLPLLTLLVIVIESAARGE